jgi:hypothetical protein
VAVVSGVGRRTDLHLYSRRISGLDFLLLSPNEGRHMGIVLWCVG